MQIVKDEILKSVLKKEDKILISNILDKYMKYEKTGISTYTNFLDVRILKIIENILKHLKIKYNIYKVNDVCEKSIIYFGEYDNFITIYKIVIKNITHSDVLGTLFFLGYDYDTIGDILIEDDYLYITNLTRLNSLLESSLYSIKNRKVKPEIVSEMILTRERFITLKVNISSYRLDTIISKIAHIARNEACSYIKDKMVLLNYEEVTNISKIVNIEDIISIRKVGKFIIFKELYKTKKDNVFIEIKKYN